jgi:hypothetical protein
MQTKDSHCSAVSCRERTAKPIDDKMSRMLDQQALPSAFDFVLLFMAIKSKFQCTKNRMLRRRKLQLIDCFTMYFLRIELNFRWGRLEC